MRRIPLLLALTALTALTACYDGFQTDNDGLRLEPTDLVADALSGFYPDQHALLEGSQLCVSVHCGGGDPTCPAKPAECFEDSATGALVESELPWCVVAASPGEGTWQFDPAPCDANAEGYQPEPDQSAILVVDAADSTASLHQWVEALVHELGRPARGAFPTDWTVADGTFRVADGGWLELPVRLSHPDAEVVAYNDARAELTLVPDAGAAHTAQRPDPGLVLLSPDRGSSADLVLTLPEGEWTVARVLGVPDAPASLELVVALIDDDDGSSAPIGARAIVRDKAGNLVHGTPVSFTLLQGNLALLQAEGLPGPDYLQFDDACLPPSERAGPRSATLMVSHGDLSDTVEFSWKAARSESADEGWTEHDACQHGRAGCGCATGSRTAPWLALPLLALVWSRRQRRVIPVQSRWS